MRRKRDKPKTVQVRLSEDRGCQLITHASNIEPVPFSALSRFRRAARTPPAATTAVQRHRKGDHFPAGCLAPLRPVVSDAAVPGDDRSCNFGAIEDDPSHAVHGGSFADGGRKNMADPGSGLF